MEGIKGLGGWGVVEGLKGWEVGVRWKASRAWEVGV